MASTNNTDRRVLLFLTSSYPYGTGEPFVGNELPYLAAEFDQVIIITNDTHEVTCRNLPDRVACLRIPYALEKTDRYATVSALMSREPYNELRRIRAAYAVSVTRELRHTVFASWAKATKFGNILRRLAAQWPGASVCAYSYWANDMALAVALAKSRSWVDVGICRAHGWDVYFERATAGALPFRAYLADNLDHYRFASMAGLAYFREREQRDYRSLGHSRLGTEGIGAPVAQRRPLVVLSCSRMTELKRVDRIVEALGRVGCDLKWIHIGDGPSRSRVSQLAATLPTSVSVEFTGELTSAEVLSTYQTSRPTLFIQLSESEGIPVAMMEAMSAGVPVIATAVGGVPEIVSHGHNGLLVDASPRVDDIAACIRRFAVMADEEYQRYVRAAAATWRSKFDAHVNYPAFITDVFGG